MKTNYPSDHPAGLSHEAEHYQLPASAVVGIRGTARKEGLHEILPRLIAGLGERGVGWRLSREMEAQCGISGLAQEKGSHKSVPEEELGGTCDLILSLGGDGSLLGAVAQLDRDLPLLGLHLGSMGYLTTTTPDGLEDCLDALVIGRMLLEKRMMLRVTVKGGGRELVADALNDVVLSSGLPGRVVRLTTRINDENLFLVTGDGLIHATPTGSTAYNLGGGGPILDPSMRAIVLTPVMPHSISVRPIVVSPDARIESQIRSRHGRLQLSIDGQRNHPLSEVDRITVERSPRKAWLLKQARPGFIGVLRNKLQWNLEEA